MKGTLYSTEYEEPTLSNSERWVIVLHFDIGFRLANFEFKHDAELYAKRVWDRKLPHLKRVLLIDLLGD